MGDHRRVLAPARLCGLLAAAALAALVGAVPAATARPDAERPQASAPGAERPAANLIIELVDERGDPIRGGWIVPESDPRLGLSDVVLRSRSASKAAPSSTCPRGA